MDTVQLHNCTILHISQIYIFHEHALEKSSVEIMIFLQYFVVLSSLLIIIFSCIIGLKFSHCHCHIKIIIIIQNYCTQLRGVYYSENPRTHWRTSQKNPSGIPKSVKISKIP